MSLLKSLFKRESRDGAASDSNSTRTKVDSAAPTERPSLEKEAPAETKDGADTFDETINYLTGAKLVLLIAALCLAIFLVALDQTIIAPALGAITAEYGSVKDIVRSPCPVPLVSLLTNGLQGWCKSKLDGESQDARLGELGVPG